MSRLLHLVINHSVVDHVGADIVAAHLRSVLLHIMESKIIYLLHYIVVSEFSLLPGAQSTGLRNPSGIRTPTKYIEIIQIRYQLRQSIA